jgi:hypothetical protein
MENSNTCPGCQVLLGAGTQYCTNCGIKIDEFKHPECPQCGAEWYENTKFCTDCGAPNSIYNPKTDIDIIPQHNVIEPAKKDEPFLILKSGGENIINERKTGGNAIRYAAISLFMLVVLAGFWYFVLYENSGIEAPGIPNVTKANIIIDQMVSTSDAPSIINGNGEIEITLPIGLFEGEKRLVVSSVNNNMEPRFNNVFDITLEKLHQFDNYIEIELPITSETNMTGSKIQAWTFSETEKIWMPIPTWYDYNKRIASIYTNHLSLFAIGFTQPESDEPLPEKNIGTELPRLGSLSSSDYLHDVLNILSNHKDLSNQARNYSWQVVIPTFDIQPPENLGVMNLKHDSWRSPLFICNPFIYTLGETLTSLSKSTLPLHESSPMVSDALSNYNRIPEETRDSPAIKDVFTSLFALEYIQNNTSAGNGFTSIFGLDEIYRTFSTTQENANPKTMAQWKSQLSREISRIQDPTLFGQVTDKFFDSQFDDFIQREKTRENAVIILKMRGDIAGDQITEQIKSSIQSDLSSFLRFYLKPAIEELRRDYIIQSRIKLQENAEEMRNNFNARHHIRCKMKLNAVQKTVNYAGSLVVFDVPESFRPKWQGVMNANETLDFYFTTAGYIEAGMPSRATLYLNQKNEKEIITVDFQVKNGTTEIVFSPDDFSPVMGNKQIDINEELKKQQQELDQIYKQLNR